MNIIGIREFAVRAIYGILAVVAVQALIATPLLSWRLAVGGPVWLEWLVGGVFAALLLGLLFVFRQQVDAVLRQVGGFALQPSLTTWLGLTLVVGIALRLLWVWWYPAAPASDGATYLALAARLSAGEPYEMAGTRAYWPPGYPLLLAPLVGLFGAGREMIVGLNLTLFAATLFVVYGLGRALGGEATGRIASAIIAVWPTYIAQVGLPEKEQPIILIVAVVVLLLFAFHQQRTWRALLAGVFLGFGGLVQPGLLLLPLAFLFTDLLNRLPWRVVFMRLGLIGVGMLLVISPWTIRNYQVFDQFVLISTNGGGVLYRANNPLATGGYTRAGEVDLSPYGELEANARGAGLAKRWIQENPMDFLKLAIEKQILFLGDDSTGVYAALRRGGLDVGEFVYALWKGFANLYWIILWVLILRLAWRYSTGHPPSSILILPLILCFLYLYGVHSIAESGGKYHLPVLGLLAIIAAAALTPSAGRGDRPDRGAAERS
ncbi:MAG: hypothetical protein EA420_00640 [Candidatus Competibacteraceae bacterium]|nr:MAG: hypothetical protein EA420_00640 [Candidatus Competibacteraceae bacterium]